tara:strand:+ start:675 stop:980 length:306 start_codon:yes stop_codon:yes gene_type:complete
MTRDEAMQLAQEDFNRAVAADMGIYLIAEAWGIEPYQVVRHKDGYGLLTEGFVVAEIAKQIMEMKIDGSDRVAANVRQLRRKAREDVGDMGDFGKRQAGVR